MSNRQRRTILFIGLGAIGRPMAERLTGIGSLYVYDIDRSRTVETANFCHGSAVDNPIDIANRVDTVLLSLPSTVEVEDVLISKGLISQLTKGSLIIDLSSSQPASTLKLFQLAENHEVGYIDAPVSGGVSKAKTGELTIMVGASNDRWFHQAEALLEMLGSSIIRTGDVGTGHAMKALNNILSAIGILGASEVLATGAKFGIRPEIVIDVLNKSTGRNQATEVKFKPFVLSGLYNAGFSLNLMLKDTKTALALALDQESPHELMQVSVAVIEKIVNSFNTDSPDKQHDHTEIAKWILKEANVILDTES